MGENGGSAEGTCSVSHTNAEMFTTLLPRASLFREKAPDRSSARGLDYAGEIPSLMF